MSLLKVTAALLCVHVLQAAAQGAAPAPAAPSASAPGPRVLREAANPLRIIVEASKIRRKTGTAEPQAAIAAVPASPGVAARAQLRRPLVREVAASREPAATGIVETVTPLPAVATSGTGSAPPAGPPGPPGPISHALAASQPPTVSSAAAAAAASAPVASVPSVVSVASLAPVASFGTSPAVPASVAPAAAGGAAALPASPKTAAAAEPLPAGTRPRIVTMVAPEFPAGVLRRVGSFNEITVQITINGDGTVGNVSVPSAAYRALEPYVVDALLRWRFEAPGEARSQRLQLVFNN